MLIVLIYLAATALGAYFLNILAFAFIDKTTFLKKGLTLNEFIILLIIIFSIVNRYFINPESLSGIEYVPEFILIIFTYLTSKSLNERLLKILILLISIEVIVGIIEYILKVPTILPFVTRDTSGLFETDLLYYNRVWGLSNNSSGFSQKVLLLFILSFYLKKIFSKKKFYLLILLSLAGFLISFNRTVIISGFVFFILHSLHNKNFNAKYKYIFLFFLLSGLIYFFVDVIIYELFRGRSFNLFSGEVDLSGRDVIWVFFTDFINENLYFGNHSLKYFVAYSGREAHAHNSFLQYLATNGVLIFCLMMILIIKNINKKNYVYIVPFILYSLTQYGIFWGFSLFDVMFFYFLFGIKSNKN